MSGKDQMYIQEINQKLSVMKNSQFRTTNFSLIEYFAENNYKPLVIDELISKLLKDYKSNPKKYILSSDKGSFKSEKNFKKSINISISRNKAFIKGPKYGQLSLNLEKTLQYLDTMYKQYINNSSQIKTPYKLLSHKNKNSKILSNFPKITEIKIENKILDGIDMEIEPQIEKPRIKSKNNDMNNKPEAFYSFGQSINNESYKNKKEHSGSNSHISSYSSSNPNINETKKENKKDIPEIFLKKLYSDIFVSYINNEILESIVNSFNNYYLDIKSKSMNAQIEKEIEKINQSLSNLFNNKKLYDEICSEINKWQNEIHTIYKIMANQLRTLKIEINIKSYSYDIYIQLREIILKYEGYYNNIVDVIKQKLNQLKDIEKVLIDSRVLIKNCLNGIHNMYGFSDFNFSRLSRTIEQLLKINNYFNYNNINNINKDYDDDSCLVNNIIKSFREEKKEIIDEMNGIDKFIGNITIY